MVTEVLFEDRRWADMGFEGLADVAVSAALSHFSLEPQEWFVSVLACDDLRIAALNDSFRGKKTPTNVLSWPSEERGAQEPGKRPKLPVVGGDDELGDIAIAFETCQREADALGKSLDHHATHLVVHATLHLLGYDHIRDQDATLMERIEIEILGKLGLPDPY